MASSALRAMRREKPFSAFLNCVFGRQGRWASIKIRAWTSGTLGRSRILGAANGNHLDIISTPCEWTLIGNRTTMRCCLDDFEEGLLDRREFLHAPEGAGSSTQRRQAPLSLAPGQEAQGAVCWEHANAFARYHCNSCGALNALTKTPIARLREMERWLDTVNAMIEGLSLPKAPRRDGIRAATAFRSRPRSQPSLGKLGAPAVAPARARPVPTLPTSIATTSTPIRAGSDNGRATGPAPRTRSTIRDLDEPWKPAATRPDPAGFSPPCINLDLFLRSYLP
jgi:hypothetical protein